jgi:hypothetical protein
MVAPWYGEAAEQLLTKIPFGGMDMDGAGQHYADRYGSAPQCVCQCFGLAAGTAARVLSAQATV